MVILASNSVSSVSSVMMSSFPPVCRANDSFGLVKVVLSNVPLLLVRMDVSSLFEPVSCRVTLSARLVSTNVRVLVSMLLVRLSKLVCSMAGLTPRSSDWLPPASKVMVRSVMVLLMVRLSVSAPPSRSMELRSLTVLRSPIVTSSLPPRVLSSRASTVPVSILNVPRFVRDTRKRPPEPAVMVKVSPFVLLALIVSVSVSAPPSTVSVPSSSFQVNWSSPAPPERASLPWLPVMSSLPVPPLMVSVRFVPARVSSPPLPLRVMPVPVIPEASILSSSSPPSTVTTPAVNAPASTEVVPASALLPSRLMVMLFVPALRLAPPAMLRSSPTLSVRSPVEVMLTALMVMSSPAAAVSEAVRAMVDPLTSALTVSGLALEMFTSPPAVTLPAMVSNPLTSLVRLMLPLVVLAWMLLMAVSSASVLPMPLTALSTTASAEMSSKVSSPSMMAPAEVSVTSPRVSIVSMVRSAFSVI